MAGKLLVLISGSGSNLQSIIDACASGIINGQICGVISNRPGVKGLARAELANIPNQVIDHTIFASREAFEQELKCSIDEFAPDLIILAGFMRVLTDQFVGNYLGKLINIHPSLLPKYPGLHTHQRAIDAGDSHHGATVHFVTPELDGGPAIIQDRVEISAGEDAQSLAKKVLVKEHQIYPQAIQWYLNGDLTLIDSNGFLHGQKLPPEGVQLWRHCL